MILLELCVQALSLVDFVSFDDIDKRFCLRFIDAVTEGKRFKHVMVAKQAVSQYRVAERRRNLVGTKSIQESNHAPKIRRYSHELSIEDVVYDIIVIWNGCVTQSENCNR